MKKTELFEVDEGVFIELKYEELKNYIKWYYEVHKLRVKREMKKFRVVWFIYNKLFPIIPWISLAISIAVFLFTMSK